MISRWQFTFASNSATRLAICGSGGFVAFGQFLDALGERLADALHLSVDGSVQRGEPFVVHHQRLDVLLGELW